MDKHTTINRRDFLRISTISGGGFLVSLALRVNSVSAISKALVPTLHAFNPFLMIGEDNSIYVILSKVEMGQGIWTTLPTLIAEELDCDLSTIKVKHSPPGKENDFKEPPIFRSTGGSETTKSEFDRYRYAGATAWMMLINAAAKRFNADASECRTENGYVIVGDQRIRYGEVATEASLLPVPAAKLREPADWKYIGKS